MNPTQAKTPRPQCPGVPLKRTTRYSAMDRPSIDPEVLLRQLVVGYLYGITSERRLMEEVRMHLGYR
jgi:transposase